MAVVTAPDAAEIVADAEEDELVGGALALFSPSPPPTGLVCTLPHSRQYRVVAHVLHVRNRHQFVNVSRRCDLEASDFEKIEGIQTPDISGCIKLADASLVYLKGVSET